ncbi:hypothetical protein [Streptomyces sp. NPDC088348]|uniref:hypothetical protein n=1 Tax=Streptomyces sp. NPDC088348 TaxID=3365853 RepID=UPI00381CCE76
MADNTSELWTIIQAAEHLGIKADSARGLLSRRKVQRVDTIRHPVSGRDLARYPADAVREVAADRRPGRRTDRT